jgi:hypothetical protein
LEADRQGESEVVGDDGASTREGSGGARARAWTRGRRQSVKAC